MYFDANVKKNAQIRKKNFFFCANLLLFIGIETRFNTKVYAVEQFHCCCAFLLAQPSFHLLLSGICTYFMSVEGE